MSDRRPLVVVLGATGLVGSAVAARFARDDVRLRLVSRRPATPPPGVDAETIKTDLTAGGAVEEAVADADVVLPMVLFTGGGTWRAAGGEAEAQAARVNVGVPESVAASAAHGTVVVFPASISQVGTQGTGRIDERVEDAPIGSYDLQKQAAEQVLLGAEHLRATSLRLPTVYGTAPGSDAIDRGVVSAMARRAFAGEPLTVWDGGTPQRDMIHVTDVAEAVAAAVAHADALAGRHWVIGSGSGVTVRALFTDVASAVAEQSGTPPVPVTSVPAPPHASEVDARDLVGDPSAFQAVTGWQAAVDLATGVRRTVASLAALDG